MTIPADRHTHGATRIEDSASGTSIALPCFVSSHRTIASRFHRGPRPGFRKKCSLYLTLFEALNPLEVLPDSLGRVRRLTPDSEGKVLEWCSRNGLLGILLAETEEVFLAPRWRPSAEVGIAEHGPRGLYPMQEVFRRSGAAWSLDHKANFGRLRLEAGSDGQLVAAEGVPASWPKPGVRLIDLRTGRARVEPLSVAWRRFYPDVPDQDRDTWPYPCPMSERFVSSYCERLDAFFDAAHRLYTVHARLSALRPGHETTDEENTQIAMAIDELSTMLSFVRPVPSPEVHGYARRKWFSPSLLTSLSVAITLDLTEGGRIYQCELPGCDKWMFTFDPKARFCSRRHQDLARKRK